MKHDKKQHTRQGVWRANQGIRKRNRRSSTIGIDEHGDTSMCLAKGIIHPVRLWRSLSMGTAQYLRGTGTAIAWQR
ncbi:MAG: hypothetical protein OXT74_10820 [Candidatus Poribacteria bacterium]|nr:hypothetical protein [Candidatus Poribacteria bacterium]